MMRFLVALEMTSRLHLISDPVLSLALSEVERAAEG